MPALKRRPTVMRPLCGSGTCLCSILGKDKDLSIPKPPALQRPILGELLCREDARQQIRSPRGGIPATALVAIATPNEPWPEKVGEHKRKRHFPAASYKS